MPLMNDKNLTNAINEAIALLNTSIVCRDNIDDMHALVMYLVDAHGYSVGESGPTPAPTPAAQVLQLLRLAMSRGAFSVPPRTVSEADAYQLLRIRNIVNEDARARHGDLPGEPSWGVVADSVLAHASQHRLAREILKVPKNRTLDQHVSLLRRADDLEADMLALRGAYLEAAGTNATLVELVGAVRRGADPEVERLRIEVQHYREMGAAKRSEGIARLTVEMAAASASRDDPGNAAAFAEAARKADVAEIEQIAAKTAIAVLEELAPRADAKALVRAHAMGRQMLRVVVAANLAADVLAVIETAIGDALSDRVGYLSVEREPGRPPDDYTVDSEHGFTNGEFTETWGWEIGSEHGGPFGDEAAAIDDAWRDYSEVYEMEKDE